MEKKRGEEDGGSESFHLWSVSVFVHWINCLSRNAKKHLLEL